MNKLDKNSYRAVVRYADDEENIPNNTKYDGILMVRHSTVDAFSRTPFSVGLFDAEKGTIRQVKGSFHTIRELPVKSMGFYGNKKALALFTRRVSLEYVVGHLDKVN